MTNTELMISCPKCGNEGALNQFRLSVALKEALSCLLDKASAYDKMWDELNQHEELRKEVIVRANKIRAERGEPLLEVR